MKTRTGFRRVVITGIGVVTPIGVGVHPFWEAALCGVSAAAPLPGHWGSYYTPLSKFWAPLPAIDFSKFSINRVEQMQLDKSELIALACASQALKNAGYSAVQRDEKKNAFALEGEKPERWTVTVGTGIGGVASLVSSQAFHCGERIAGFLDGLKTGSATDGSHRSAIDEIQKGLRMPMRFNPMTVAMTMPNGCSATVGIKYGLTGPNVTCTCACAAGTVAIGAGFKAIAGGESDAAIVGGVEYLGDEFGGCFRGFDVARTLAHRGDGPDAVNRPFDRDRSGFLFAEGGGAMLVIEERERALRRGAPIVAEIAGFAQNFDAHSMMAMEPSGRSAIRMIEEALAMAGLEAPSIDYVNSHGTGTVLNDETESRVIEKLFGKKPLVNSTKSLIGHTIGASGAIEAAVTALSLRDGKTHISKNVENPVRDLNFVTRVERSAIKHALSQSFAFGGHNACLVFSRHEG
jgi:3-oxoacyl-[acyl-carrier-protein] synthase II